MVQGAYIAKFSKNLVNFSVFLLHPTPHPCINGVKYGMKESNKARILLNQNISSSVQYDLQIAPE